MSSAESVAARLASPSDLEQISITVSALEIVFAGFPERLDYHAGLGTGTRIASSHNGAGDQYRIYFRDEATVVRAFEHENSDVEEWAQIVRGMPSDIRDAFGQDLNSGQLELDLVTFGAWRRTNDAKWSLASESVDDKASSILGPLLDWTPEGFRQWAELHLEIELDTELIVAFYEQRPLKRDRLLAANPFDLESAEPDLIRLGYTIED